MKIYISGQFSGLPYGEAYENFARAEDNIKRTGHEPVNPLKHISQHALWPAAMREAIKLLMDCDAIFLMDSWKNSEGARLEFEIAMKTSIRPYFERDLGHLLTVKQTLNY